VYADHTNAKALFISHIEALRSNPFLRHAWIIVMIERNTGHEAGHLSELLGRYQKVYTLYEKALPDSKRRHTPMEDPGIVTDMYKKGKYAKSLSEALNEGVLRYLSTCICANPFKDENKALEETKRELHAQISRARWITNSRSTDMGFAKSSWSACTGADGKIAKGVNDDLVITLSMNLYWTNRILSGAQASVDYEMIELGPDPNHKHL
jgi:hypothetical protein